MNSGPNAKIVRQKNQPSHRERRPSRQTHTQLGRHRMTSFDAVVPVRRGSCSRCVRALLRRLAVPFLGVRALRGAIVVDVAGSIGATRRARRSVAELPQIRDVFAFCLRFSVDSSCRAVRCDARLSARRRRRLRVTTTVCRRLFVAHMLRFFSLVLCWSLFRSTNDCRRRPPFALVSSLASCRRRALTVNSPFRSAVASLSLNDHDFHSARIVSRTSSSSSFARLSSPRALGSCSSSSRLDFAPAPRVVVVVVARSRRSLARSFVLASSLSSSFSLGVVVISTVRSIVVTLDPPKYRRVNWVNR